MFPVLSPDIIQVSKTKGILSYVHDKTIMWAFYKLEQNIFVGPDSWPNGEVVLRVVNYCTYWLFLVSMLTTQQLRNDSLIYSMSHGDAASWLQKK